MPIPRLSEEDLREIPLPAADLERFDYGSINKKDALLRLARHFWKEVCRMWGDKVVWVDIRDLIGWIGLHLPLRGLIPEEQGPDKPNKMEQIADYTQSPERMYYDPDLIKGWAENFSNRLAEKERAMFLLSYGKGSKLKEMAAELGYKGSSGPKYMLDSVSG